MPRTGNSHSDGEILRVVRQVRRRWRLKLLLRGVALTLAGVLVTFVISASSLEALRFVPGAVTGMRILLWVVITFFLVRSILWPLLRPVSDERVALYLEEHEPLLQSRVLTAVESAKGGRFANTELSREVVRRAVRRCRRIDYGKRIEQRSIRRSTGLLGGLTLASVVLLLAGPRVPAARHVGTLLPGPRGRVGQPVQRRGRARRHDHLAQLRPHGLGRHARLRLRRCRPVHPHGGRGELFGAAHDRGTAPGPTRACSSTSRKRPPTTLRRTASAPAPSRSASRTCPAVDRLEMVYHFPRYTGLAPRRFEYGGRRGSPGRDPGRAHRDAHPAHAVRAAGDGHGRHDQHGGRAGRRLRGVLRGARRGLLRHQVPRP